MATDTLNINPESKALTLVQYNKLIGDALKAPALSGRWVIAELSDVNVRNHCYLELIEKDSASGLTVARMRAIVWASTYYALSHRFEQETGQKFTSGIKVMVRVNLNFHEQYGISVIISDIDTAFTLGDMARRRREILQRLEREGILNDNKSLEMPMAPQRVAIISGAGAAGYGDFMNQLMHNPYGFAFYTALFPALMQGVETPKSIIAALGRIADAAHLFDCVLITRGGGSSSDLNWFDDYDLAANVAQFPLPIITAIGHERDNTVLDYISYLRVKTPTAAAEWLVGECKQVDDALVAYSSKIAEMTRSMIAEAREKTARIGYRIPQVAQGRVHNAAVRLQAIAGRIPVAAHTQISTAMLKLNTVPEKIDTITSQRIKLEQMRLEHIASTVNAYSPERTLRRGYSITRVDGKAITDASVVPPGVTITTTVAQGTITSKTI